MKFKKTLFVLLGLGALACLALAVNIGNQQETAGAVRATCIDNDNGTVTLPAACPYETLPADPLEIIDGLPPGTTIEMDAVLTNFVCNNPVLCSMPLGLCTPPERWVYNLRLRFSGQVCKSDILYG